MHWTPPIVRPGLGLRAHLPEAGWRDAVVQIAERHGLGRRKLEPYPRGETIVWRADEHVIKLTAPRCAYQIEAEVACLQATSGKLSLLTPRLHAHGTLAGWPYVVMERIEGLALSEVWPGLDHVRRRQLARGLGTFCRELHSLPCAGFPDGWDEFWNGVSTHVGARLAAAGESMDLLASVDGFLESVQPLTPADLVPLHTELIDAHVYVRQAGEHFVLAGVIDFADARRGASHYEFGGPAVFIFKGEPGLLREFLLAYGVPETCLTAEYSRTLLAWSLCHRFANLSRMLSAAELPVSASLEELARRLFSVREVNR